MEVFGKLQQVQRLMLGVRGGALQIFEIAPSLKDEIFNDPKKKKEWCEGAMKALRILEKKVQSAISIVEQVSKS